MNFLGHLYFSRNDHELMYANLFGDHVKGTHLENYPESIRQGIFLHRSIDHYIDHHPAVIELLHSLYTELPKVAGIAVDLYFDHLLAVNWNKYHSEDLESYLERFYTYEPTVWQHFPEDFRTFISQMKKYRWMNYYARFEGLEKSSEGVASRISFPNKLKDAPIVFLKYRERIENSFFTYMQDAIPYFEKLNIKGT
jgi:acyl carrier protein phosphodiesterase